VTNEEIRAYSVSKNPHAAAEVDNTDFNLWKEEDIEESVKEDVLRLRNTPSLYGLEVYGFILDTPTGVVREVEV
jgi:carbonic anhydrase